MESMVWLFSPLFPVRIGIWKCWLLWRDENRSTRRKTLGAETRIDNKFNPHNYDAKTKNRTHATLVGGECSHHCTIPAPTKQSYLSHSLNGCFKITEPLSLSLCLINFFLSSVHSVCQSLDLSQSKLKTAMVWMIMRCMLYHVLKMTRHQN